MLYTVDNYNVAPPIYCNTNEAVIPNYVPSATYIFSLQTTSGDNFIGMPCTYKAESVNSFTCTYNNMTVTAEDMEFAMCKAPNSTSWNRFWIKTSGYTTNFTSGQNGAFVVHMTKSYGNSYDPYVITYAIRDESGNIVALGSTEDNWDGMWTRSYCELTMPVMPTETGNYTVEIFFNGALAGSQDFSVK